MKEFIKKHTLLLTGIILYLIVYIISCKYDPWVYDNSIIEISSDTSDIIDLYIPDILEENRIIQKIPLEILYFGIADAAPLVYQGLIFSLFIVTYAMLIFDFFLQRLCLISNTGKVETFAVDYIYGNILLYFLSILLSKLSSSGISEKELFEFLTPSDDLNIALKILVFIAALLLFLIVILFFILPSFPTSIYFFTYILMFKLIDKTVNFIDVSCFGKLLGESFAREIMSFVTATIIIIAFNIIMEKIYSIFQKLSILPARKFIKLVRLTGLKIAEKLNKE